MEDSFVQGGFAALERMLHKVRCVCRIQDVLQLPPFWSFWRQDSEPQTDQHSWWAGNSWPFVACVWAMECLGKFEESFVFVNISSTKPQHALPSPGSSRVVAPRAGAAPSKRRETLYEFKVFIFSFEHH